ncbi:MAG TPA: type 2 lanthipeptide synthetase LanM [Solirubrobacteraceae bacterium]
MTGAVLDALVAEMLATVRSRADDDLRSLGAAPAVLDGIGSHFREALSFLLGSHVRDQTRIWEAISGGWPQPDATASDAFAAYMRADGWAALFERLPSLEALLSTVVELEAEAASLLLARAAADAGGLAESFGAGGEAGPLTRASIGLSDPHNGRRTVASLEFAGGMHVIYKPRPVAMERALTATLDRLRRGAELDVPAGPRVLELDGYGWCEFVEHRPCASREDVDRYFRRLGALAAVLAALAATDCHADNFVARGADPILVDAETLLHPRLLASPGFSVLETEIVPSQVQGPSGQLIDYAGFDAPTAERDDAPNLPVWGGRSHRLGDHRAAFDQGVDAARDALGSVGPVPVRDLANRQARVVLRPTSVYAALLAHTISASELGSADGGLARVERELIRYQDPGLAPDVWDAVRRAELAALTRGDVPYFLADTTTGDLQTLDGELLGAGAVDPVLPQLEARIS